jgi:hypothetical protein
MIIDRWPSDRAASQESETVLRGKKLGIEIVEGGDTGAVHVFMQDSTEAGITYRVCLTPRDAIELHAKLTPHIAQFYELEAKKQVAPDPA